MSGMPSWVGELLVGSVSVDVCEDGCGGGVHEPVRGHSGPHPSLGAQSTSWTVSICEMMFDRIVSNADHTKEGQHHSALCRPAPTRTRQTEPVSGNSCPGPGLYPGKKASERSCEAQATL